MKRTMLMIFVDADHAADVEELLDAHQVPGYSEIPAVRGKGQSGRKLGSRAFPGSSTLYLVGVDDACRDPLIKDLERLQRTGGRHEGLKVYATHAEELI